MSHLFFWRQGQAGAVRYDGGKDGLKAEGEEGVEPEHEAVAALADVGRDLEAGHSDHHLVEGAEHDVACVAHGDGVGGGELPGSVLYFFSNCLAGSGLYIPHHNLTCQEKMVRMDILMEN